jgi:hypothetical protein
LIEICWLPTTMTIALVSDRCDIDTPAGRLHLLRNRVAHSGPLIRSDLPARRADLLAVADRLSPTLHDYIPARSLVPTVLKTAHDRWQGHCPQSVIRSARRGDSLLEHPPHGPTSFRSRAHRPPVEHRVGPRPPLGLLLGAVPGPVAVNRHWLRAIDPLARRAQPGVRTVGSAGGGRREYYGARDLHRIAAAVARWDGVDLGGLAPVVPAVRFGFGSAPAGPPHVRITTLVERALT